MFSLTFWPLSRALEGSKSQVVIGGVTQKVLKVKGKNFRHQQREYKGASSDLSLLLLLLLLLLFLLLLHLFLLLPRRPVLVFAPCTIFFTREYFRVGAVGRWSQGNGSKTRQRLAIENNCRIFALGDDTRVNRIWRFNFNQEPRL